MDFEKLERNVRKMMAQNAPVEDIDGYLKSQGTTPDAFKAEAQNRAKLKSIATPKAGGTDWLGLPGMAIRGFQEPVRAVADTLEKAGKAAAAFVNPDPTVHSSVAWQQAEKDIAKRRAMEMAPVPRTPTERGVFGAGEAAGETAALLGGGQALRGIPRIAKAGEFIASQPYTQLASNILGGATAGATGSPMLGAGVGAASALVPVPIGYVREVFRRSLPKELARDPAIELLAKELATSGKTRPEIEAAMATLGPDATLADVDANVRALVGRSAGLPGESRAAARALVEGRGEPGGRQARVAQTIRPEGTTGPMPRPNAAGQADLWKEEIATINDKARKGFLQEPVSDTKPFEKILSENSEIRSLYDTIIDNYRKMPGYVGQLPEDSRPARAILSIYDDHLKTSGKATADRWLKAINAGLTEDELRTQAAGVKGLTVDIADRVRQNIAAHAEAAYGAGGATEAVKKAMAKPYQLASEEWSSNLRSGNAEYGQWLDEVARLKKNIGAAEHGTAALKGDPNATAVLRKGFAPEELQAFNIGFIDALNSDPMKYGQAIANRSGPLYEQVEKVLGKETAERISEKIRQELTFGRTEKEIEQAYKGKKVIPENPMGTLEDAAIGTWQATHNWIGPVAKRAMKGLTLSPERIPQVRGFVSDMALSTDPAVQARLLADIERVAGKGLATRYALPAARVGRNVAGGSIVPATLPGPHDFSGTEARDLAEGRQPL